MKHSFNEESFPYEICAIGPKDSPSVCIYLALSAHDSLHLDPFNQPAKTLAKEGCRVLSITIPGHEPPLKKEHALELWDKEFKKGNDLLTPFFKAVAQLIDTYPKRVGIMGLSRGGFCALHIAHYTNNISHIALFAPLLSFDGIEKELIPSQIAKTALYLAIGNNDRRVHTKKSVRLYQDIVKEGKEHEKRGLPYVLRVNPSIGYMGHGTSPETFEEGALWLSDGLLPK